ncbi:hypothetical protein IB642_06720 [Allofrancisella guangzhouensis]|uniref:DUF5993 family protein n=1 Tax=Allofrancisella guangzhouensis TaxID=594679 RepID=UPI000A97E4F5|nr:DUF5993 family protein [Allofrancisella guangzhouensis]MBK2027261.1 hypothetical protein [Allofrancisella guangzhouensis]MBK2044715.1 hypothetical protein [Allofrancisella guangzhouensis]MBK2045943.1 hypothetical protein [Allofrancisella guangzhouensis]
MPAILISFIFLFVSVVIAWFNRRWGVIAFSIFIIIAGFTFLHHMTDHLPIHL